MTSQGLTRLEVELRRLKTVERPTTTQALAEAREQGDIAENAEYHAAKERQGYIEARVREIEDKISRADVIDVSKLSGDAVTFGATVTLADEDTDETSTYRIVGAHEAAVEDGLLSITSPLARALIGKSVGDSADVTTPRGEKSYEIVDISFG